MSGTTAEKPGSRFFRIWIPAFAGMTAGRSFFVCHHSFIFRHPSLSSSPRRRPGSSICKNNRFWHSLKIAPCIFSTPAVSAAVPDAALTPYILVGRLAVTPE